MLEKTHDIVIIGGGPAGLTAAIYACRAMYNTIMIDPGFPGGQIAQADIVENYPGFPDRISGLDLSVKMYEQAKKFGLSMFYASVTKIEQENDIKVIYTDADVKVYTRAIILSTGASPKRLSVPGEDLLLGRGVSYCATCDGALFKGKEVVVVGGGDTAVGDAIFLTKFATRVHIIHRRDSLRASKIVQMRAFNNEKIEFHWNSVVSKINGNEKVSGIDIEDVNTKEIKTLPCEGVFILVGTTPNSDFLKPLITTDENDYILVNSDMETNISGIYSAGDVNHKVFRQVVTAVGDGATAAYSAQHYLENII